MKKQHRYLIETSKPFTGECFNATFLDENGIERAFYAANIPLDEYLAAHAPRTFKAIPWAEFSLMLDAFHNEMKTPLQPITADDYQYALEVLPPKRWQQIGEFSVFHCSEGITGPLVAWYFADHKNAKYFTATDDFSISKEKLQELIAAA